jgi:hypothetical protein
LNDQTFKNSKTFKYLGCLQNIDNNYSDEIISRVMSAYDIFNKNLNSKVESENKV